MSLNYIFRSIPASPLRRALSPLPCIKRESIIVRLEGDLGALGEVKHVAGHGMHALARLVGDVEGALDDDLHLVVGVCVDEGGAFFEAVEACGEGLLGVDFVAGGVLGWC